MNNEQSLNRLADGYRNLGYNVVVRPKPEDLPPFAKDFKVEVLATGAENNVLAIAKGSPVELEADADVARYVETTNRHAGWRFDVFVLPATPRQLEKPATAELSEEHIRKHLGEVESMLQAGFVAQSLIAGWAALEAVMRRKVRANGESAGWGTSPRTLLNELYSSGTLSTGTLRELESSYHLRNAMAHGFSTPAIEPASVDFLIATARDLLAEAPPAKRTA